MTDKPDGKRWGFGTRARVLVLVLLVGTTCVSFWLRTAAPVESTAPADRNLTQRDIDVIIATLKHFVAHEESIGRHRERRFVVDHQTAGMYASELPNHLTGTDGHQWRMPQDTFLNLTNRNLGPTSIPGHVFGDSIVVEDLTRSGFDSDDPERPSFARLWLPGFSNDGKQAVVIFHFGPTPHGAVATYLLEMGNGRWIVKEYGLLYYA
jgi:hypothetical protein